MTGAAPRLNDTALIEYNWAEKAGPTDKGDSGNWSVIGIDPASEITVTNVHSNMIAGSYLAAGDTNEIVLGVSIAGGAESSTSSFLTLGGINVGDIVQLTYPNGVQKEYTVKGIFRTREGQADNSAFKRGRRWLPYSDRLLSVIRPARYS